MAVVYRIEDNVVTQEQYEELDAQLENKKHLVYLQMRDGGRSPSIATHRTNGRKYKITSTQRGNNHDNQICEAEPAL
jgi:hypothetical protein